MKSRWQESGGPILILGFSKVDWDYIQRYIEAVWRGLKLPVRECLEEELEVTQVDIKALLNYSETGQW